MTSINTNQGAMVALDTLQNINRELQMVQSQISTGKKISNARDNAAVWAIATTMESDVMAFKTITDSLNLGSATVGLARSAAEQITSLLQDTKSLIVSASEENKDRTKIQTDIVQLRDQIEGIVNAAQTNGLNLLKGGGSIEFLSSLNRDADSVEVDRISVSRSNLEIGQGDFGNGGAITKATLVTNDGGDDASAVGESDVFNLAAQVIDTGDSFRVSIQQDGVGAPVDYEYVAREGDTANDVVRGLESALAGVDGLDVTIQTSSNPSQNNVSLTITNRGTGTFAAATTIVQESRGTAVASTGGLANLSGIDVTSESGAADALTKIEDMLELAIDTAASFGSAQKRIDIQNAFIDSLVGSLEIGVSALTDANLEEASARLQSLQVQQQLGLQSLAIANQSPQSILALFR